MQYNYLLSIKTWPQRITVRPGEEKSFIPQMLVFGRNLSSVVCFAFISLCRIAVGSSGCDEMIDPMNLLMAVRNYSEHPSSTSKPYVPVSFNIARDVFVGHLRGLHEILKMDLEVIIFRPTDSRTSMSPMHLKEVARYPIKEDEIKEVCSYCLKSIS